MQHPAPSAQHPVRSINHYIMNRHFSLAVCLSLSVCLSVCLCLTLCLTIYDAQDALVPHDQQRLSKRVWVWGQREGQREAERES